MTALARRAAATRPKAAAQVTSLKCWWITQQSVQRQIET